MATTRKWEGKEFVFKWQGIDRHGTPNHGETRATGKGHVHAILRRQNIKPIKITKQRLRWVIAITSKDVALFTRQLATLFKAGVPLLQSFDIVGRGNPNPGFTRLLQGIRTDIETGTALSSAFRKHPKHFDNLYCNLIEASEAAGLLDQILERLAIYMEKTEAIRSKIKSALLYPLSVLVVALTVTAIIMIFVVPTFKEVFSNFGTELPLATRVVIALSGFFISYGWLILAALLGGYYWFMRTWQQSKNLQFTIDKIALKLPIFGPLLTKSCTARWTRTLAIMYAAGVPLIDALRSVGGAAGNFVYERATLKIQQDISNGTSLSMAMSLSGLFPPMALQMCVIGEESGSIDHMLGKVADFYDAEVDDRVAGLSSLIEPLMMVVLGIFIGCIVVAMYLPLFKLGQIV
jgi:type IV pilus assembly protein PilC